MPQFDVHRLKGQEVLVVDCQSDLFDQLNTRFMAPLVPRRDAPTPAQRLNPAFVIGEGEYIMVTQFAAAVNRSELGAVVHSLRNELHEVIGALDVLVSGV